MTDAPILEVSGFSMGFSTPNGTVGATEDISFSVSSGDVLAIIGESGSGKTVTSMAIARLISTPPAIYMGGTVRLKGVDLLTLDEKQMAGIRGRRIGTIFQNPRASLDPSFTIASQLVETLRRHDSALGKTAAREAAIQSLIQVGFNEPERVMASYPHQLSGGMCQRIALAMTLACKPEILIADEPTTALDVGVQARILLLLKRRSASTGLPIVIITHDMGVVAAVATRVLVMYGGHIQESAPIDALLGDARHPYTQALMAAIPDPDGPDADWRSIEGEPPNLALAPKGCRFAPRCDRAKAICREEVPAWRGFAGERFVRCHLAEV